LRNCIELRRIYCRLSVRIPQHNHPTKSLQDLLKLFLNRYPVSLTSALYRLCQLPRRLATRLTCDTAPGHIQNTLSHSQQSCGVSRRLLNSLL
jgi:hypothetical protein